MGLLLSTVDNYLPNSMVKTKWAISGVKFVVNYPIRIVEYRTNSIFGFNVDPKLSICFFSI
jgi:hypothetical protein